jgi:hypothetical protein
MYLGQSEVAVIPLDGRCGNLEHRVMDLWELDSAFVCSRYGASN